ncbi:MAG: DUF4442 domain-containing protein [Halobacteriovoraceae bacterium]|nr:DUF4442 domain-containing protein [Halobacteriovoraceae bacterium]MCB9095978.1 DUF4442 domain-containing protein [Halobacteriovoraceae bacterium]
MKFIRFWPPYFAAGVSVESINKDFNEINVKMVQNKLNTNYVGTHFGGSLYAMCDPFYMFILLHHLKEDHIVWDQAAKIDFIKPGKGTMRAKFTIPLEEIEDLRKQALQNFNLKPIYHCEVIDKNDDVVAKVEKFLYVRRKDAKERFKKS